MSLKPGCGPGTPDELLLIVGVGVGVGLDDGVTLLERELLGVTLGDRLVLGVSDIDLDAVLDSDGDDVEVEVLDGVGELLLLAPVDHDGVGDADRVFVLLGVRVTEEVTLGVEDGVGIVQVPVPPRCGQHARLTIALETQI